MDVPFYQFDVLELRPKRLRVPALQLALGIPNDMPCIRFAVATQILSDMRDGLNARETKPISGAPSAR